MHVFSHGVVIICDVVFDLFGFHVCLELVYVGCVVQRLRLNNDRSNFPLIGYGGCGVVHVFLMVLFIVFVCFLCAAAAVVDDVVVLITLFLSTCFFFLKKTRSRSTTASNTKEKEEEEEVQVGKRRFV